MFKVVMFVKKKSSLTMSEFVAHWQQHSEKVLRFKDVLKIKDYRKTFPLLDAAQPSTQRETQSFDFDAMGELWYSSKADFIQARNSAEGQQALAELKKDEQGFVDLQHSVMWFGEEQAVGFSK